MICRNGVVHILFGVFVDLIQHRRGVRWWIGRVKWLRELEVQCTVTCLTVKNLRWYAFHGNLVGAVLGDNCDVYKLVPLWLIYAGVDFEAGFQFLVGFLYQAVGLCMLNAITGLFCRLFYYLGGEGYVRDVCVSCEKRPSDLFATYAASGHFERIANMYLEKTSTAVGMWVHPFDGDSGPIKLI